ncbi:hypothetical protein DFQ29_004521 [Apophysomyces sp. BC1021]|nr:hypothetical protein DFQ29_004521 [Apophysomyces sp. BC1021]
MVMSANEMKKDSTSTASKHEKPLLTPLSRMPSQLRRTGTRHCPSCDKPCSKGDRTLVRALGEIYHYNCLACEDCHTLVADKFYTLDISESNDTKKRKRVVCEQHYYAKLGLICQQCDGKCYHQCFKCPGCMISKMKEEEENEACYEFNGRMYCRYHFSMLRGNQCGGCGQAILKQFVEHQDQPKKKWHPECYMIFKYWNVRLAELIPVQDSLTTPTPSHHREIQDALENQISQIWTDLSSFEDSSATCISDMLLHVAAGAYLESLRMANHFVMHLEVLFAALDGMHKAFVEHGEVPQRANESKLVCKQVIRVLNLLAQNDEQSGHNKTSDITQELLTLVTNLAQNLKMLIRFGLTEALRLKYQYEVEAAISRFLSTLLQLEKKRVWIAGRYWFKDDPLGIDPGKVTPKSDRCRSKDYPLPSEPSVVHVAQSEQYLYLLKVALARLYLRISTPEEPIQNVLLRDCQAKINRDGLQKRHPLTLQMSKSSERQHSAFGSVHIGSVKRARSSNLERINEAPHDHIESLVVKRALTVHDTSKRPTTPNTRTYATARTNRLTSLRRALSSRRERVSLYGVFDKHRRTNSFQFQQAQRASICTLDTESVSQIAPVPLIDLHTDQDFIMRRAATILVRTNLSNLMPPEELDALVECKKSFWGKLKTHIRASKRTEATFGVSLALLAARDRRGPCIDSTTMAINIGPPTLAELLVDKKVLAPLFVKDCIRTLLQNETDLSTEGIFRKNGNIRELKEMRDAIDKGHPPKLTKEESPIQLAALLKRFLRELPEPLLTFNLHDLFVMCARIEDRMLSKQLLHFTCCMLPKPHRDTMQLVFLFLKHVASYSSTNRMDISNLATVIAPSVLYARCPAPQAMDEIKAVEMLIRYQEEFCMVPPDIATVIQCPKWVDNNDPPSKQLLKRCSSLVKLQRTDLRHTSSTSPLPSMTQSAIVSSEPISHRKSWNTNRR